MPKIRAETQTIEGLQQKLVTKRFVHADLLQLTTPQIIIPATEVLNYEIAPTKLFVPMHAFAVLNTLAGAYSNIIGDGSDSLQLVWSSVWDLSVGISARQGMITAGAFPMQLNNYHGIGDVADKTFIPFFCPLWLVRQFDLQDNALCLVLNNSLGAPAGGHADNTMDVTVLYHELDIA